jgi:hypothetical protein
MIPEPAEPDSLFCIGPDHEMPSAANSPDINADFHGRKNNQSSDECRDQ